MQHKTLNAKLFAEEQYKNCYSTASLSHLLLQISKKIMKCVSACFRYVSDYFKMNSSSKAVLRGFFSRSETNVLMRSLPPFVQASFVWTCHRVFTQNGWFHFSHTSLLFLSLESSKTTAILKQTCCSVSPYLFTQAYLHPREMSLPLYNHIAAIQPETLWCRAVGNLLNKLNQS